MLKQIFKIERLAFTQRMMAYLSDDHKSQCQAKLDAWREHAEEFEVHINPLIPVPRAVSTAVKLIGAKEYYVEYDTDTVADTKCVLLQYRREIPAEFLRAIYAANDILQLWRNLVDEADINAEPGKSHWYKHEARQAYQDALNSMRHHGVIETFDIIRVGVRVAGVWYWRKDNQHYRFVPDKKQPK